MVSIATTNTTPIRVALTNDFDLVVAGLAKLLATYPDRVRVVDTSVRGDDVDGRVDVALFDTFTHNGGDLEEIGRLLHDPAVRRVALFTWQFDPTLVDRALSIGVTGYLSKALGAKELVDALESVASGRQTISPDPASDRHSASEHDWPGRRDGISERESEVLILIAEGLSNKQIVECLDISPNSVKTHIRNAYRKLGVATRAQAVPRRARSGNGPLRRQSLTAQDEQGDVVVAPRSAATPRRSRHRTGPRPRRPNRRCRRRARRCARSPRRRARTAAGGRSRRPCRA